MRRDPRTNRLDAREQRGANSAGNGLSRSARIEIGIGDFKQTLQLGHFVIGEARDLASAKRPSSRPSRGYRGASSETTAAYGGHQGRRSIGSIQSLQIQSNAKSPGRVPARLI